MQRSEQGQLLEPQSIVEDAITDYDDNCLGCEAMIGELNTGFSFSQRRCEANTISTAHA